MRIHQQTRSLAVLVAVALPVMTLTAQHWSVDDLREQAQGFHEDGLLARLRQISHLVGHEGEAALAVATFIHGDHQEYLLKIDRLLDQLADDRWLAREDAERNLVEIGARALARIGAREKSGETLEERIRCKRIRSGIRGRGTEKEESEIRLLRGMVASAAYLQASPKLIRALVSAMGHTDPQVVEAAVRALGVLGGDEQAQKVYSIAADRNHGDLRRTGMAALTRMKGPKALSFCEKLLFSGELKTWEAVAMVRDVRMRPDAKPLLAKLKGHSDPVIAQCAALELPEAVAEPRSVTLSLSSRDTLTEPFLGFEADSILVRDPVPGLPRGEIPLAECDVLDFDTNEAKPLEEGAARLFLTQGTLLTGKLLEITATSLTLDSLVFGKVEVSRGEVQGLALDASLDRLVGASHKFDRLRLNSGSFMDGAIGAVKNGVINIVTTKGKALEVQVSAVAGVLFKRPPQIPQDANLYTRIDLISGDRILAHLGGATRSHFAVVAPGLGSAVLPVANIRHVELGVGGGALWGFTLIADYSENRIIEVDDKGRVVFSLEEVYGAWDVECLDNGNLLITEFALNRVKEVTRDTNEEVWVFEDLKNPNDADRLANGNTLIADTFGDRVIEVSPAGKIVWKYDQQIKPYDVERLPNGNTLIADGRKDRVIEVSPDGKIVWQLTKLAGVHDVDRLANGNTLVTQRTLHRVIEVDRDGKIVFSIDGLASPSDADRLPNGHTLIAENGRVSEFDRKGVKVMELEIAWAVEVNRY